VIERLNVGKMAALHKMVNKFNEMSTQILTAFSFAEGGAYEYGVNP